MSIAEQMFYLIRNEIKGEPLPDNTRYDMQKIYTLSKRHDIAHLIGDALFRNKLLPDDKIGDAFKEQIMMAVIRVEQQISELERIKQAFDNAKIPYIPLKGAVIRDMYPKPWMRTSCDIDILVREEDLVKAIKTLIAVGFECDGKKNYHDIHLYNGNIHLELHYNICENNKQLDGLLSEVWNYAEPVRDYEYRETNEYYVFHHIAHMAYHFLGGGCGIRPLIDLWILKQKKFYNEEKLCALLEQCNLIKFYETVCKLAYIWLNNEMYDDLTMHMEKYVLSGGVYGNSGHADAIGAATSNGKRKYLLKIAFPPYKIMCIIYPSLKKHKILLPFCYIHRVFIKVFGKDKKRVKERINSTFSQSEENIAALGNLLNDLGLHK